MPRKPTIINDDRVNSGESRTSLFHPFVVTSPLVSLRTPKWMLTAIVRPRRKNGWYLFPWICCLIKHDWQGSR